MLSKSRCFSKSGFFLLFALFGFTRLAAQFTPPHVVAESRFYTYDRISYDWDGDGDLDFIGTHEFKYLDLYENIGGGQIADLRIIDTFLQSPVLIQQNAFADLNADGRTDVMVYEQSELFVYLQMPDGQMAAPQVFTNATGLHFNGVAAGDLDGDGDVDIAALGPNLQWYENDGTGYFSAPHFIAAFQGNSGNFLHRLSDVDADGRLDALVYLSTSDSLLLFLNQGGNQFQQKKVGIFYHSSGAEYHLTDLDGDGLLDLLPIQRIGSDGNNTWQRNLGGGDFTVPQILDPSTSGWFPNILGYIANIPGDLDGDGDMDVVSLLYNGNPDSLFLFENLGNGQFSAQLIGTGLDVYSLGPGFENTAVNDFDGDGLHDLVGNLIAIVFCKNLGNNQFAPSRVVAPVFSGGKGIETADFDGDGKKDLLANLKYGKLAWFQNLGTGQWGAPQVISEFNFNQSLALPADLDGDGDPDVLVSYDTSGGGLINSPGNELYWYENLGGGQFGPSRKVTPGLSQHTFSAHVVDLDADGDLDLLYRIDTVFSNSNGAVLWVANDGFGNFGPPINIDPNNGFHNFVDVADMDHDGDPDVIGWIDSGYNWYKNDGTAIFDGPYLLSSIPYGGEYTKVADMDGDTLPDLVFPTGALGMSWSRNPGNNGLLDPPKPFFAEPLFLLTYNYHLADLNGDGQIDLLCSFLDYNNNHPYYSFGWVPNLGNGVFSDRRLLGQLNTVDYDFGSDDLGGDGVNEYIVSVAGEISQLGYLSDYEGLPSVTGRCFLDANGNGLQDSLEVSLPGIEITLSPSATLSRTDGNGIFRFIAPAGQYTLGFQPDSCWALTTDSMVFHLTLPLPAGTELLFGFRPDLSLNRIRTLVSSAGPVCGQIVPFWLSMRSEGCHAAKVRYRFELGSQLTWDSASIAPTAIIGDTIFWEIDSLLQPGEQRNIVALIHISPAVAGDTVVVAGIAETLNPDDLTVLYTDTFYYTLTVFCSYDPNDKRVDLTELPPGYGPDSATLTYTIRFQNTGNYLAFNIRIRDTLDTALDWTTFKPLAASHPYFATLDTSTRLAQFDFPNIFLPDSTSNEPESHGFVAFSIRLKPGIQPGAGTRNRAGIYFDVNAPVITNWAETKVRAVVSANPFLTVPSIKISPNPNDGVFVVDLPQPAAPGLTVHILDLTGQLVLEKRTDNGGMRQTVQASNLPAGLYLLQVLLEGEILGAGKFVKQ